MGVMPNTRRRWIGASALAVAIVMLIAGQSVLRHRLSGVWFLAYWAVCFVLTAAAMVVAILDARDLARGTVREQRDLMESTLKEIQEEAKTRNKKAKWN